MPVIQTPSVSSQSKGMIWVRKITGTSPGEGGAHVLGTWPSRRQSEAAVSSASSKVQEWGADRNGEGVGSWTKGKALVIPGRPHAQQNPCERGLLMGSLGLFEDMEIQPEALPRALLGLGPLSCCYLPQHIATPPFPGWNRGFQMCHLDFILK